MRTLQNIFWLGTKELRSFFSDWVLLGFVIYSFSLAVISQAQSNSQELFHASIGIVDEDHSDLSRRIADGLTPPTFKPAIQLKAAEIDAAMNSQRVIYAIEIPPKFQADILAGRHPTVQINVDATAAVPCIVQ